MTIKNHEQRLHEINTLEWDELVVPYDPHKLNSPQEGITPSAYILEKLLIVIFCLCNFLLAGKAAGFELPNQYQMNSYRISVSGPGC